MKLEIRNFRMLAPSNVNYDDVGQPKSATTADLIQRQRVSSQSRKSAMRNSQFFDGLRESENMGDLSRGYMEHVVDNHLVEDYDEEARIKAGTFTVNVFLGKSTPKGTKSRNGLSFDSAMRLSQWEQKTMKACYEAHLQNPEGEKEIAKKYKEIFEDLEHIPPNVDMVLYGRMCTANGDLNMEGCTQVAHSISMTPMKTDIDFFSAFDKFSDNTGSAHLGTKSMASSLFYEYICVDVSALREGLNNDDELASRALSALIHAALLVTPNASQSTMCSRTPAPYAMFNLTTKTNLSLHDILIPAIQDDNPMEIAISRLRRAYRDLQTSFGYEDPVEFILGETVLMALVDDLLEECGLPRMHGSLPVEGISEPDAHPTTPA